MKKDFNSISSGKRLGGHSSKNMSDGGTYPVSSYVEGLIASDKELLELQNTDMRHAHYIEKCVRHIWSNYESGKLNFGLAVAGYDFATGWPVYQMDLILDILDSYSYPEDASFVFVNEFSHSSWVDGPQRIVIQPTAKAVILDTVKPLTDIPGK